MKDIQIIKWLLRKMSDLGSNTSSLGLNEVFFSLHFERFELGSLGNKANMII